MPVYSILSEVALNHLSGGIVAMLTRYDAQKLVLSSSAGHTFVMGKNKLLSIKIR